MHTYGTKAFCRNGGESGGNTFALTHQLHDIGDDFIREGWTLMDHIIHRVTVDGISYMGWSAGAVIASPTMQTTNDMAVIEPVSFESLGLVPFHINPHYRDPVKMSAEVREKVQGALLELFAQVPALRHELDNRGETRDDRLEEFILANPNASILALREGAMVKRVHGEKPVLAGTAGAKVFKGHQPHTNLEHGDDLEFLLERAA